MGNTSSNVENNCIDELSKINENDLDISNIDKLQIKAIKEMNNKIKELENKQHTKLIYAIPKVDLSRLFYFHHLFKPNIKHLVYVLTVDIDV